MPPSATRAKDRSRTYTGIAEAMADQWTRATRPNDELSRDGNDSRSLKTDCES
jgi:hypothetical protein